MSATCISSPTRSLTEFVAKFAVGTQWYDIPPEVMHLGKKSILDVLGCTISGSGPPTLALLRKYHVPLRVGDGAGGTIVIGANERLPPRFAAPLNGTAMHTDDYDDTQQTATAKFRGTHPSAPVVARLMAQGEAKGGRGKDMLVAYQVGVEVACTLFHTTAPGHVLSGFNISLSAID